MKKIAFFIGILVCLLIIQGLVRSIWTLWEKKDVLVSKQEELTRAKKRYENLKAQEKRVRDPQFAEGEIRNKLFLVKPDEKIVVLPSGVVSEKMQEKKEKTVEKPSYQQWFSLFFNGLL